jgi:hypothetical protein
MLTALLLALQASPLPLAPAPAVQSTLHLAEVEIDGREQLATLLALDLDLVEGRTAEGRYLAVVDAQEFARLAGSGLSARIVQRDLEQFYAARLAAPPTAPVTGAFGNWLNPPFGSGGMGGYYTWAQIQSVQDQLSAAHPARISPRATFGSSIENRPLQWQRLSDNPLSDEDEPEVRIDALHHAREPQGMQSALWFMLWLLESYPSDPLAKYLVEERELYFILCVNPDGYVHNQNQSPGGGGMWRKNRRNNGGGSFGVDLNRNYAWKWGFDNSGSSPDPNSDVYRGSAPASEPEIQAMQAFLASRSFRTALSVHTYSNLWLSPYGYDEILPANQAQYLELGALATAANAYTFGPIWQVLYLANGSTVDYDHDVHGTWSWTPEIGSENDGFWPPPSRIVPLAEENLLAFQRTALAAGAWVRLLSQSVVEQGDGDGFFEAGESVRFVSTLKNSGRAATTGGLTLTLSSSSPHVGLTQAQASLPALASFAQSSNASTPLELALLPSAPAGAQVVYQVAVTYEGWTQAFAGTLKVGSPRRILRDDAEIDWGWTKGLAGDTATSGKWTRGDPLGTNSGGQPANPEDDASPAPGVQCYLTGNAGGSAGNDDVDNGATTLLSPVFDLSHVGPATLRYSRWYADLSQTDDVFAVSISNDGGTSWVAVENLATTQNSWNALEFTLADLLPQTSQMRLRFVASDQPNNSLVEAAVDELELRVFDVGPRLLLYGAPALGGSVLLNVTGPGGAAYVVLATLTDPASAGQGNPHTGVPWMRTVTTGVLAADGSSHKPLTLPSQAQWAGKKLFFRAAVAGAGLSNWDEVQLP